MKTNGIIFIVAFVLAFAGGYFYFSQGNKEETATTESGATEPANEEGQGEEQASVPAEAEVLNTNSCLSCHAVNSLGIEGGTTGPDLSHAYDGVKDKHGVDLDSFLKQPTSAVMSGVIAGNPLSDEDRAAIIDVLKTASEK
ncbi:cytochrome C [Sporosarcina sp. 179-K 3D1 HS]|uniref:c-type cytochrome n=1 Tax=Sporosarcina sp. 179-K 3D1 HS TaxID=3232169 RepID=UPI0039A3D1BA